MVIDGGSVDIGVESTILDMTVDPPMILRPGAITKEMLEEVIGEVDVDRALLSDDGNEAPKAPGMKYKHYAPKADMIIVDGDEDGVIAEINSRTEGLQAMGKKVAVIATEETKNAYRADVVLSMGARDDEDSIAQHMYKILRDCDELEVEAIYSESFKTPRIGQAIMNRLLKAAGHQVLHV
jgi:L-threonylcarbamoyladenylate synthase